MEEIKIYQQIDWNGFHIGTNADLVPGAIDIEAPIYDSLTHKAKLVDNVWIIKPILEWELKEGEVLFENTVKVIGKPSELYTWDFDTKEWYFDSLKIEQRKTEINQHAYNEIVEKYPLWKQINITRIKDYNEETLAEYNSMITFIDEIRAWADYEVLQIGGA